MGTRSDKLIKKLSSFAQRPYYLPLIGLLLGLDLFVAFIPSDIIVITSSLLKPKRKFWVFFVATLGSALGATALASTMRWPWFYDLLNLNRITHSSQWQTSVDYIDHWGWLGMAFIAFGPLPQQPFVLVCGLSNMPLWLIGFSVWLGRAPKYGFYAWASSHAPALLKKILGKINLKT